MSQKYITYAKPQHLNLAANFLSPNSVIIMNQKHILNHNIHITVGTYLLDVLYPWCVGHDLSLERLVFLQLAHLVVEIDDLAERVVRHVLQSVLDPALRFTEVTVELREQQRVVELTFAVSGQL